MIEDTTKAEAKPFPSTSSSPLTMILFGSGQTQKKAKKDPHVLSQLAGCTTQPLVFDGPNMLGTNVPTIVEQGVQGVLDHLQTATEDANGEIVINMAGFSRGATNCLRIANRIAALANTSHPLSEKLQKVRFNMFLIDPVAGLTNKRDFGASNVPSNVKNLDIVFSKHEMRRSFRPQDLGRLTFRGKTNVHYLILPGNHSDVTKAKNAKTMVGSAKACSRAVEQFFTRHGTQLTGKLETVVKVKDSKTGRKSTFSLPESKGQEDRINILNDYAALKGNSRVYEKYGQRFKLDDLTFAHKREIGKYQEDYVKGSDFFINQEERELLKVTYPGTFNRFFEHGVGTKNNDPTVIDAVKAELEKISYHNPEYFKQLQQKGYFTVDGSGAITLGKPRGSYRIEDCRYLRDHYPLKVTAHLPHPTPESNELYQLETQLIQLIHRQRRIKNTNRLVNELMVFVESPYKERLENMHHQMDIILNGPGTDAAKKQRLLAMVKENYRDLVMTGNEGRLSTALGELLVSEGVDITVPRAVGFAKYLGLGIKGLATVFRYLHNLTATIAGIIFYPLEALGLRFEQSNSTFLKYVLGYPLRFFYLLRISIPTLLKVVAVKPLQELSGSIMELSASTVEKQAVEKAAAAEKAGKMESGSVAEGSRLSVVSEPVLPDSRRSSIAESVLDQSQGSVDGIPSGGEVDDTEVQDTSMSQQAAESTATATATATATETTTNSTTASVLQKIGTGSLQTPSEQNENILQPLEKFEQSSGVDAPRKQGGEVAWFDKHTPAASTQEQQKPAASTQEQQKPVDKVIDADVSSPPKPQRRAG